MHTRTRIALTAAAAVGALALGGGGTALAQTTTPTPPPTTTTTTVAPPVTTTTTTSAPVTTTTEALPSPVQICAATNISQVDALLSDVAESELVGALKPLVDLTVPQANGVEVDAAVDLDDVRQALNCNEPTPSTSAQPTADVDPPFESCAEAAAAGVTFPILRSSSNYSANLDSDSDGFGCEPVEGGGTEDGDTGTSTGASQVPIGAPETGGE